MKLIDADEAFRVLSDYYHHRTGTQADALREALDRVPEAVVDEKECIVRETSYPFTTKQRVIGVLVRCKDCKWWVPARCAGEPKTGRCKEKCAAERADGFCSHGGRNTAESE